MARALFLTAVLLLAAAATTHAVHLTVTVPAPAVEVSKKEAVVKVLVQNTASKALAVKVAELGAKGKGQIMDSGGDVHRERAEEPGAALVGDRDQRQGRARDEGARAGASEEVQDGAGGNKVPGDQGRGGDQDGPQGPDCEAAAALAGRPSGAHFHPLRLRVRHSKPSTTSIALIPTNHLLIFTLLRS